MTIHSRFLVLYLAASALLCSLFFATARARGETATTQETPAVLDIAIHLDQPPKPISPDLFGIFFEDINYAADGGLYGELIQNRSFEYQATEVATWNSLTSWDLVMRGGGKGSVAVDDAYPIHPNNPHYAVLEVSRPGTGVGAGVGLMNGGFDGIPIKAGEIYDVALFARHLYAGGRWSHPANETGAAVPATQPDGKPGPLIVQLESKSGEILGQSSLQMPGKEWTRLATTIIPSKSDEAARFVILMTERGGIGLDVISLFPRNTFLGRPNGLRADLAQVIADLKPKFVRFPGGCLTHGNGLGNIYRWKDTIGPIEQRKEQANLWHYNQTVGLGFFEYFQFCEDIGAKPLPVVAAGVCCQNSGYTGGTGQQGLPLEQMPQYTQDVLDLIEYANGPVTSTWGAKRAAAGHPKPFNLQYLGLGNEDAQTPVFRERFKMIYDGLRAKYPQISIIGMVGPSPDGTDYDAGWKFADELGVEMVDEHYYELPIWFLNHQNRYDTYDRARSKVYVGEYASRGSTLAHALAEASYMSSLERNGDVVRLASYAPLLGKLNRTQWNPDLIYFNNTTVFPTVNYYVQQMYSLNQGDLYLPNSLSAVPNPADGGALSVSSVQDSKTGDIIIKLVNTMAHSAQSQVQFTGKPFINPHAIKILLAGDPTAKNDPAHPRDIIPITSGFAAGESFNYEAPAYSLTVIRVKTTR